MTYQEALKKRKIETLLVMPIVLLGKLFSGLFHPKGKHKLFILAPSADIGGANMNNADLAKLFEEKNPIVIFSKIPKNNQFRGMYEGVKVWDLHRLIDHKIAHFINVFYRGVIAGWINKTPGAVVLGGESIYFYKVLPWLHKEIPKIDLTHVDAWFDYTQQFVQDIDTRIFSTNNLLKEAQAFYKKQGISTALYNRMVFIDNMVPLFDAPYFTDNDTLEVLFIGRGSPQKRVELIAEIAKTAHQRRVPVHISFIGDVSNVINPKSLPFCTFYGNVKDRQEVLKIQQQADVLLLTSKFEGLPMSVMEMMSLGKAIVSTAVNAIPDYIKDGVNGYLLPADSKDKKIIEDAIIALSIFAHDRMTLREMGEKNFRDTHEKFGKEVFEKKWREVVEHSRN